MKRRASATKPIVFISHIVEERNIAYAIQRLVEKSFVGMMTVFVSSSPLSIQPGDEWLNKIKNSLRRCAVEIILASPQSIRRPWINFEGGAGWIRNIAVIPLCHSGMTPSSLPMPLNQFQSATATVEAELRNIFPVLATALGSDVPEADFSDLIATIRAYEAESKQFVAIADEESLSNQDALPVHVYITLSEIAGLVQSTKASVPVDVLKDRVEHQSFRPVATLLAINLLERKSMVETFEVDERYEGTHWAIRITDEGWAWLQRNHTLLDLRCEPPKPRQASSPNDEVPF